jgi:hypothetical protein
MIYFDDITMAAFDDELEKIAQYRLGKTAGVGDYLIGGVKALGRLAGKGGSRVSLGGLKRHGMMSYRKAGGGWKGVKAFANAPVGQAATVAGIGGLAGYGGYRAVRGGGRQGY